MSFPNWYRIAYEIDVHVVDALICRSYHSIYNSILVFDLLIDVQCKLHTCALNLSWNYCTVTWNSFIKFTDFRSDTWAPNSSYWGQIFWINHKSTTEQHRKFITHFLSFSSSIRFLFASSTRCSLVPNCPRKVMLFGWLAWFLWYGKDMNSSANLNSLSARMPWRCKK